MDSSKIGDLSFKLSLDAIVVMNVTGEITGWNPAAEALFGWSAKEAVGKRVMDLIIPEQYRASHEAGLHRFRQTGKGPVLGKVLDTFTAMRRDGSEFPIEIRISHQSESPSDSIFVAFLRDISTRKWTERSMHPTIQYARSGDVHVAYQVIGEGLIDLVIVPGWVSHLEVVWEEPQAAAFLRRLGEFSRVIMFDKRGTGMSDPISHIPALDERMDDIRAVMDAAASKEAALLGYSEGGPLSIVFAAAHPDRVSALIQYASSARFKRGPDYPFGFPGKTAETRLVEIISGAARTGEFYDFIVPSRKGDERFREWFERFMRLAAANTAQIQHYIQSNSAIDIRELLPSIHVPTLVLHRREDNLVPVEHGRYLAQRIPGAKYVELDGGDHWPWFGDTDAVVQELEEFLTGVRRVAPPDRVLAAVMFTDIVGSTERVAEIGDRAWRELLDQHDVVSHRQVERFRGRRLRHTGDGVLATFDGPARAVQCAHAIQDATGSIGLRVRAGLHVGECEIRGEDIGGIAVHIARRVAEIAAPGEILVSSTVRDLVAGSGIEFNDRGARQLKGVSWRMAPVLRGQA